jgi:hypothetical protein
MKTFVKENWYKLMVGTSMMMASFGFMIYAVSPAYSNSDNNTSSLPITPQGTNGVVVDGKAYFVDGGYIYICETDFLSEFSGFKKSNIYKWVGTEFGQIYDGQMLKKGCKTKLP